MKRIISTMPIIVRKIHKSTPCIENHIIPFKQSFNKIDDIEHLVNPYLNGTKIISKNIFPIKMAIDNTVKADMDADKLMNNRFNYILNQFINEANDGIMNNSLKGFSNYNIETHLQPLNVNNKIYNSLCNKNDKYKTMERNYYHCILAQISNIFRSAGYNVTVYPNHSQKYYIGNIRTDRGYVDTYANIMIEWTNKN